MKKCFLMHLGNSETTREMDRITELLSMHLRKLAMNNIDNIYIPQTTSLSTFLAIYNLLLISIGIFDRITTVSLTVKMPCRSFDT